MDTLYTSHELDVKDLKDMIRFFDSRNFFTENLYYDSKNTYITDLVNQARIDKPKGTFNIVRSGFYKKICDQTANYLVGQDVTITGLENKPIIDLNKFLLPTAINASKNGRAWVHFFPYKNKLKYKIIDATEIIPIFDTEYQDILKYVIRFYRIQDGTDVRIRVEVWDDEKVTYFLEDPETKTYFLDYLCGEPQVPHLVNVSMVMGQESSSQSMGWGRPPFIELKLNNDRKSELTNIKKYIDCYDKVMSGFMDNVDDIRDAILLIKDRGSAILSEIKEKIEEYRALFVDDVGDASYLTLDIPVEARNTLKNEFRASIYEFAFGVDMQAFTTGGGNITNVYIQALFHDLDAKCRGFSKFVDDFILEVLEIFNVYNLLIGKPLEDLEKIKITYNKSIPSNVIETIDAVNKSKGVISDETIFENHPLVTDAKEEQERIDNEVMAIGGGENDPTNTSNIPEVGDENDSSNGDNNTVE